MEFGIYSFVDHGPDPRTGNTITQKTRYANILEEIELADRLGLDVFGIGEHHRSDFIASAPAVVLAAAASRTKRIRLTSAVTVLSSEDPVRVFQQYATLDLISNGRAEIMAGRGSFTESFPLFGYDLKDYDALYAEHLDLLLQLRKEERISWQGRFRPSIDDREVQPRPVQQPLPVWIAVGGTPNSVIRAAQLGMPLVLAIIGGEPARFKAFTDLYRRTWHEAGHDPANFQLGIGSHGFIADTFEEAAELTYPAYAQSMGRIGKERGWGPVDRRQFDFEISEQGAMLLGDPGAVTRKILHEFELFGFTRYSLQFSVGTMPHDKLLRCIELYATQVVPAVRKALSQKP